MADIPQAPDPAQVPNIQLPETVQVYAPDGSLGTIPAHQLQAATEQGYTYASPESIADAQNEEKYGGVGQQAITALEGAGRGVSFGLSSGVERAMGVDPKDILARQKTNPISSMVGEGAGIAGSLFIPVAGEANLVGHAGEGVLSAATHLAPALGESNLIGKLGSAAVKGAVENAIFAGGDEVSKAILQDPEQTFQSAVTDIGLSGLIGAGAGAAFGSINPLWEATVGSKVTPILQEIQSRANGNMLGVSRETQSALDVLGKDLSPEARSLYANNPAIKSRALELAESGTEHGNAMRTAIDEHLQSLNGDISKIFQGAEQKSQAELGEIASKQIEDRVNNAQDAFNDRYEALKPTEQALKISDDDRLALHDEVKGLAHRVEELDLGAPNGPAQKAIDALAGRMTDPETLKGYDLLRREIGGLESAAYRDPAKVASGEYGAYKKISEIITDFQDKQVAKASKQLGAEGFEHAEAMGRDIVRERQQLRADYAQHKAEMRELAEMAGLGRGASTAGRIEAALEKKSGERLASTLFDVKNVKKLDRFEEIMPDAFKTFKDSYKQKIFQESMDSHGELSQTKLFNKLAKIPKEVQAKVFTSEEMQSLKAIQTLRSEFPERMNPSGTARTLDGLKKHGMAGLGSVMSAALGHNPILGALMGEAAQYASRDLPDAVKLSLLKFLGSSGPVDASAWKTASDMIEKVYKGQALIEKATKAVFIGGKAVLPESMYPDQKRIEKLDRRLEALNQDPSSLMNIGGKTGTYMPETAQAMGMTAANAVSWLNSQRPKAPQLGILDARPPVPQEVKDHWERTLSIADQPLVALSHLKEGTLQAADVQTVQTLYPKLYTKLVGGLTSELINAKSDATPIPYKTLLGLSLFMAQPLDGTMTPQGIQALQSVSMQQPQQQGAPQETPSAASMKAIGQQANRDQTPGQQREQSHA